MLRVNKSGKTLPCQDNITAKASITLELDK